MSELTPTLAWVALSLAGAFAINMLAEWMLLTSEKRFFVVFGRSIKTIVIPALIAIYVLIIADVIGE